jgi:hypothetical protein
MSASPGMRTACQGFKRPCMSLHTDRQQLYALTREEVILQLDGPALERAQAYYQEGCVRDPAIQDAVIYGTVVESAYESHAIEVSVLDGDIYIGCTCEHAGPGICAHVGSVLLAWVEDRASFAGYDQTYDPDRGEISSPMPDFADEFRELLGHQTINELRTLARRRGIEIQGTRKEPIVEELTTQLCDLEQIRSEIGQLDDLAQELLIYLHLTLSYGYGFTSENIIGGLQRQHSEVSRRTVHTHLVDLVQRGLLLTFKQNNLVYYILPQAVRVCLPPRPGFIPPYPEQELEQLETPRPVTVTIQSLYTMWNYIVEKHPRRQEAPQRQAIEDQWPQLIGWRHVPEEVQEVKQRRRNPYNLYNTSMTVPAAPYHLRRVDLNALREQTAHSDEENEFYYMLLQGIGAIVAAPGETISCRQEVFERILSLPASAQMYAIIHTWINSREWSEMDLLLRSVDEIRVRRNLMYSSFEPKDLYHEWRAGRQTVLRFLSILPEGCWVSVENLLKAIFGINPNLLHTNTNTATWWIESSRTRKQFGTTFEDWQDSVGRFVLAVLEGPLAWLGAVGLGYKSGKLMAIKVTPVGSFALQRRQSIVEAEQPMSQEAVRLHDDLSVTLIPGRAPAQLHDLLHFVGQLEEATPEQFVYCITAEGVLLALEQGLTIEGLLDQISKWCNAEIPAAWYERMQDWSQNYGKLHVYDDITLIEMADDYALQELMSNTALREHVIYAFSPRLVAIQPDAVDDLVQEMEKRGYTPHVE